MSFFIEIYITFFVLGIFTYLLNFYSLEFVSLLWLLHNLRTESFTAWKVSKYWVYFGPNLSAFGLKTEGYGVSLHIQSESGTIRIRKSSVFGYFSRSVLFINNALLPLMYFFYVEQTYLKRFSKFLGSY